MRIEHSSNNFLSINHFSIKSILYFFLILYAFILPFSAAFSTHTGPYLLLVLWFLDGDLAKKWQKIRSEKAFSVLIVVLIYFALSLLWSENLSQGIHLLKYYVSMVFVLFIYYTSLTPRLARYAVIAFLTAMFINEVISYGIYFGWWQVGMGTPNNPSPFMHHIKYSIYLSVTIFLLVWQIMDQTTPKKLKIFEFIFLLSATTNLFVNGGRTGQLALIFASIIFTVNYFGLKLRNLLYVFILLVTIFSAAYTLSPNFHNRVEAGIHDVREIYKGNLGTSWGLRVAMKIVAFQVVMHHPIFGVGIGDAVDAFEKKLNTTEMKQYSYLHRIPHVHDQYLQILLQTGMIGIILFIYFLYQLFRHIYHNRLIKSVSFAVFTIYIFSFFTEVIFRNFTGELFCFLIALLWFFDKQLTTD